LKGEEMTKTPGEFEPTKPISKAERDARKTFRKLDAEKAMTEHEIEQKAFSANRERLKAERLTRRPPRRRLRPRKPRPRGRRVKNPSPFGAPRRVLPCARPRTGGLNSVDVLDSVHVLAVRKPPSD
jgi:hypothetical protein